MKSSISIVANNISHVPDLSKLILQVTDEEYQILQVNPENCSIINSSNTKIIVFVFEQWNEGAKLVFFKVKSLFPSIKSICVFEKSDHENSEFNMFDLRSKAFYADKVNFNYQFMDAIINLVELTETEEKTIEIANELKATRTKMKYYALTTLTILFVILILNALIS